MPTRSCHYFHFSSGLWLSRADNGSFPDESQLGPRLRLHRLKLPRGRSGCNHFPLNEPLASACASSGALWGRECPGAFRCARPHPPPAQRNARPRNETAGRPQALRRRPLLRCAGARRGGPGRGGSSATLLRRGPARGRPDCRTLFAHPRSHPPRRGLSLPHKALLLHSASAICPPGAPGAHATRTLLRGPSWGPSTERVDYCSPTGPSGSSVTDVLLGQVPS
jgi:hypothetical protein